MWELHPDEGCVNSVCVLEQLFVISRLCCNFQPCDAADVQEPTAQEKESSPHELLLCDNGTS